MPFDPTPIETKLEPREVLARFLETQVPVERFKMEVVREDTACGTVGCIAGWASTLPMFHGVVGRIHDSALDGYPYVNGDVFAELLGTDEESVDDLIEDFSIKTPQEAAARVRALPRALQGVG